MDRIYLSPPHMGGDELRLVQEAFESNWVATVGPHVDAFEQEFSRRLGVRHAAALSSGTAALHLAMKLVGVRPGDEVLCSTLTFVASANPILYEGGRPVFVDSDEATWNMDPALLAEELDACARRGRLPRAVVLVHLYGQSADIDPILEACERHGVPLVEDAAESLGATYKEGQPGSRGRLGVFSFNGNKIITTSGGGMLVSNDPELIHEAKFLSTQGRDLAPHYEHSRMAYNYRMSNVLAAIGRGQLRVLEERVRQRRGNFAFYREAFADIPGITLMPEADYGTSTRWLTVLLVDPEEFGASAEAIRFHLECRNIEARPVWKPMHLQPLFAACRRVGGDVAAGLFGRGLCLPSGSQLSAGELERIVELVLSTPRRRPARQRKWAVGQEWTGVHSCCPTASEKDRKDLMNVFSYGAGGHESVFVDGVGRRAGGMPVARMTESKGLSNH
jgi:dTDP-4-amino-4,6-dideoxygalactose transaminase